MLDSFLKYEVKRTNSLQVAGNGKCCTAWVADEQGINILVFIEQIEETSRQDLAEEFR